VALAGGRQVRGWDVRIAVLLENFLHRAGWPGPAGWAGRAGRFSARPDRGLVSPGGCIRVPATWSFGCPPPGRLRLGLRRAAHAAINY